MNKLTTTSKMKKTLLIGFSLLTAAAAFSQASAKRRPYSPFSDVAHRKYTLNENAVNPGPGATAIASTPVSGSKSSATTAGLNINWNAIGKSINAFGVLGSDQKQLDYDENLNAVLFIHRKSPHYLMSPA